MKRAYILIAVFLILVFASLMIGLSWYLYIPEKISQIVGIGSNNELPAPSAPAAPIANESHREISVKIGEMAAYRKIAHAEINVTLTNLDNFKGDAKIFVALYYAQLPVANSTTVVSLNASQKAEVKLIVNTAKNWNAFEVKQIG